MDRLTAMRILTRVAAHGSVTAASRELGMSTSAVSRHLAALEDHLGVRLLNRTTRRISLTEAGASYVERALELLAEIEDLERDTGDHRSAPRGTLRVNAPMTFGHRHIVPAIPEFLAAYPDVSVDLTLTDVFVDLVDQNVDVAIRVSKLADSTYIARRLQPAAPIFCAAPAYLASAGTPTVPDDLKQHNCIVDRNRRSLNNWRLYDGDEALSVPVAGNLTVNSADAARDAAKAGVGIAFLPDFIVADDLDDGTLIQVLPDYRTDEYGIYAIYPHRQNLSAKVRVFVDFLVDRCDRARAGRNP